jgi:hypothetical protein
MRWALSALTFCLAALLLPASAAATTATFSNTGGEQTFTVPIGVHRLHVLAIAGHGGPREILKAKAGKVTGDIGVTPGQTLYVEVGGDGHPGGLGGGVGGFNGGGDAGSIGGGGGGGASDIRTSPRSVELSVSDTRLIVAGGGGGGGASGETGVGGEGGSAGEDGEPGEGGSEGGEHGKENEGGVGGGGTCSTGEHGGLGFGGLGGEQVELSGGGGGGGGGGLYGGGGGGGTCSSGAAGGGGGSSLVPMGGHFELAEFSALPRVEITYNPPPSIAITAPANGASYTQGQAVSAVYACTAGEATGLTSCAGTVANGAVFDTETPGQHTFTVTAEDSDAGTTTQSVTYTVVALQSSNPLPAPDTTISAHPKSTVKTGKKKATVKFSFTSDVPGATFQCKLDKGSFAPCTSPKTYRVKRGSHTFSVEAVGPAGTDATPATFSFKVKKKR